VPAGYRLRLAVSSAYWPQLWPSPELALFTLIADGSSLLDLPVRDPAYATTADYARADQLAAAPEFLPAENSTALDGEIVQNAERTRRRNQDTETDAASIEDVQSCRARITATDTEYSHVGTDRWSVLPSDPLSARAECHRTVTIERGDWHARVETQSALFADEKHFHLENDVVAFNGDREVFRREWRTSVPRDGV
jgi:hypothetical protein